MMDTGLKISLIANAGLLMTWNGTTLMVDGIYGQAGLPFSVPSPADWQDMLRGEGRFRKVDYLLFTHAHPDHFSPEMTGEFLRHRQVKGVFLPEPHTEAERLLMGELKERGVPYAELSGTGLGAAREIEPGIRIRAVRTLHLDRIYRDVPHYCCLLTFGDRQILLTADVDYTSETLSFVKDIPLDAAFVNPMFFTALCRGKFFKGTLPTRRMMVYHVPFPEDDGLNMRPLLRRNLDLWPEPACPVTVLGEPFQTVEL